MHTAASCILQRIIEERTCLFIFLKENNARNRDRNGYTGQVLVRKCNYTPVAGLNRRVSESKWTQRRRILSVCCSKNAHYLTLMVCDLPNC